MVEEFVDEDYNKLPLAMIALGSETGLDDNISLWTDGTVAAVMCMDVGCLLE